MNYKFRIGSGGGPVYRIKNIIPRLQRSLLSPTVKAKYYFNGFALPKFPFKISPIKN